jgi:hypothetical protein
LCGGLSVASRRRARPHDLIALIEEKEPGLSDDVRDQEELMRAAIRLLELSGSKGTASSSEQFRSGKLDVSASQLRELGVDPTKYPRAA